jgi:hypothetical protein
MRKLRRLPWRIPKNHHSQPNAAASPEVCPHAEAEREARREAMRESLHTQPVAFAGGRYVAPVPSSPEIRRKARHRTVVFPVPVAG